MQPIAPYSWTVDVAGMPVELPVFEAGEDRAIALLMVIDRGLRFVERAGRALAETFRPLSPEIVVGSATLGIPVAMEVSRALGLDQYVVLQKSPKFHLSDALVEEVRSITSHGPQRLLLDRAAIERLQGRRVVVVDDVIATGSSMAAAMRLVRRAGAEILAAGTILTEGRIWRDSLGRDAGLVRRLGHIPQFRVVDGRAEPLANSMEPRRLPEPAG
ncbi:phosphoribosyltransferase family protein [Pseudogemmobacter sonorensis]|uniref:phosphoribosyltransferase family protein n=1 Tax=Pseudogemmobacter sonorensis TaxID=2989681 RepID=UPI00368A74B5